MKSKTNHFDFNSLQEASQQMISDLEQKGWKVSRTWLSKQRPYKFSVTGSGNLRRVGLSTNLYTLKKLNDQEYQVSFFGGTDTTVGEVRRSVVFNRALFRDNADVYDSKGRKIDKIDYATHHEMYTVRLKGGKHPSLPPQQPRGY